MNVNRLWILGAADPEMAAIEKLLRECGEHVQYATVNGVRVHPGNAYGMWEMPEAWGCVVYLVECDPARTGHLRRGAGIEPDDGRNRAGDDRPSLVKVIDHHRPGDPGYGRPPAEFLAASSLGQVIAELSRLGVIPLGWERARWSSHCRIGTLEEYRGTHTVVSVRHEAANTGLVDYHEPFIVPRDLVFSAAADHCLGEAYRGECPGVDPDELMIWRANGRAKFRGCRTTEILLDVEEARQALEAAHEIDLTPDRPEPLYGPDSPFVPRWSMVSDMRGRYVPELPEAGTRYGYSYIADAFPADPSGRSKIVCSGTADVIRAFLEIWAPANGLVDCYGDPARGFAGGYQGH